MEVIDAKGRAFARPVSGCAFVFRLSTAGDHRRSYSIFHNVYRCGGARFNRSRGFLRFAEQWTFILRIHGCYPAKFVFLFGYVKDLVKLQA